MRRTLLLILSPIIIVGLLLLVIWKLAPGDNFIERNSDDGRLLLVIPMDALPAGTDPDSIRIVTLNPATVSPVAGRQPRFAYRLEPEGLQFAQPVQLGLNPIGWKARQLPMLLHRSRNSVRALPLDITVNGNQVETVTTELHSFSEVLGFLSVLSVNVTDPGDQAVGETFFINADTGIRPSEINRTTGDPNGFWTRQRVATPVTISGGAFTAIGNIRPDRVADKPAKADLNPTARHLEIEAFECTVRSTGNQINYQVQAQFKLFLSDSTAPGRETELTIDDRLTVNSTPFGCVPPPPPRPTGFNGPDQIIDSTGEEYFEIEVSKAPGGKVMVGEDFTLTAEIAHLYIGNGTPAVNGNWEVRYGRFEFAMMSGNAVSPRKVDNVPFISAAVASHDSWSGNAQFRCVEVGSALIDYKAFVYYPAPGTDTGMMAIEVTARAEVECITNPNVPGGVTGLHGSDRVGPIAMQEFNNYGGFMVRWWRDPAASELPVGTQINVHVEVENLRYTAAAGVQPENWLLSGVLYTQMGTGLDPARYPEAPAYAQSLQARATWSGDYVFTCRNPDLAALRHDFTVLPPASMNLQPLQLSVTDPGVKCLAE
jgi:hypothetical protein